MLAYGLVGEPNGYFLIGWNYLDFAVSIISLICLNSDQVRSLKVLRALKSLRAVRFASLFPEVKLVIDTTLQVVPHISEIVLYYVVVLYIFSIVGMTLFKGQFRACGGDMFSNVIQYTPYEYLLTNPVPWGAMSATQKLWFGPSSNFSAAWSGTNGTSTCGAMPCCEQISTSNSTVPTSRDICECWGGTWQKLIPGTAVCLCVCVCVSMCVCVYVCLCVQSIDRNDFDDNGVNNIVIVTAIVVIYFCLFFYNHCYYYYYVGYIIVLNVYK